ncbi:MAG TPA: hypothetical protein VNI20_04165 [Fimbriimonadaceae bacterium]|nr:hypothetical protein [Fimbriimonadaceae bacterium]
MKRRITIIGNGGSGKTTVAVRLGEELRIPVHHMDKIQWRPGWQRAPEDEVEAALDALVENDEWIIDGLGAMWTIEKRLPRADLVVLLDLPVSLCIERALGRQTAFPDGQRPDVTEGCDMRGTDERLVELLKLVDSEWMPKIRDLAASGAHSEKFLVISEPLGLDEVVRLIVETARQA